VECVPLSFAQRAPYYRDGDARHRDLGAPHATQEVETQNPVAWPILLDMNGNLCEGPGANLFLVKDGEVLILRRQYVLAGISRETAFDLAHELSIPVREADIDLYDAYTADEAFSTFRLTKTYSGLVGIDIAAQYLERLET